MTFTHSKTKTRLFAAIGILAAVCTWTIASAGAADAASVLNGPINLGTAATYGTLSGSAITNTGPTTVNGDLGVSPGSSISGFTGAPSGSNVGAVHDTDAEALQAKSDLTTAYNVAAGLTPTTSGLAELNGMSLTPGVYSGGALSLSSNGTLTLAGTSADSVWVFQAASSLIIGSASHIVITGGASACNVFWKVGSSATLGTSAQFKGTILASKSVTAATGASVVGRLLASTGAVTLQSNSITVPTSCAAGVAPVSTTSPEITSSAPTAATLGVPYSFIVTASGTPTPTFSVTGGQLPDGLNLDGATGEISGTPTTQGAATFNITVTNPTAPAVTAIYTVATGLPVLALTGSNPWPGLVLGGALLLAGGVLMLTRARRTTTTIGRAS